MTLTYYWDDVKVNLPQGDRTKQVVRNVIYDYDINIQISDVVDYLMPIEEKEKGVAYHYMKRAIDFVVENGGCDLENIDDPYFKEFLHERYEGRAWESFQDGNEEY